MDDEQKKQQQEALKRAQQPKRPSDLPNAPEAGESLADDAGFERPERVEHTSEKEHPPGKE